MADAPKSKPRKTQVPPSRPEGVSEPKVKLVFSETASKNFEKFPLKVREGLKAKLKDFALHPEIGKPLSGDLQGFYRVTYGRIRSVVRSDGETPMALIVVADIRKEDDRNDPYEVALGVLRSGGKEIEALFAKHLRAYLEEQRLEAETKRSKRTRKRKD